MLAAIEEANNAESGTNKSVAASQRAIFYLMAQLEPTLGAHLSSDLVSSRALWIAHLKFLTEAQVMPALRDLATCLEELDRGVTAPELAPKAGGRRGGLSGTNELQIQTYAVEAATELRRRCVSSEEYRAELKLSGTQHSTIEAYRKAVLSGPTALKPRSSYILAWGSTPPEMLLARAVAQLRAMRENREK